MKTPQRIFAIILATVLATTLFACSQGAEPETTAPEEPPVEATQAPGIEATTAPGSEATQSTPATPNAQGVSDPWGVVQAKCTVCHTIDKVTQAQKDWNGWNTAVDHMVDEGAKLTTEEREAVVDYLASRR